MSAKADDVRPGDSSTFVDEMGDWVKFTQVGRFIEIETRESAVMLQAELGDALIAAVQHVAEKAAAAKWDGQ